MKICHTLVPILLLLLIGCKNQNSNEYGKIVVDVSQADYVLTEDFASDVKLIPLELTKSSAISNVTQLIVFEGTIIVFDKFQSKIFIFNDSGKFQFAIDNKGQGPAEYSSANSIRLYGKDHLIIIHDQITGRFLIYNAVDGEFIRSLKVPYIIEDFVPTEDGFILFSPFEQNINPETNRLIDYGVFLVDTDGHFKRHILTIGASDSQMLGPNFIQNVCVNNGIYFLPTFWDTIYVYGDRSFEVKYSIDFGKNSLPDKYRYSDYSVEENLLRLLDTDFVHSKFNLLCEDEFIYFTYAIKYEGFGALYIKSNQEVYCMKRILDSFNKLLLTPPSAVFSGSLYGALYPDQRDLFIQDLAHTNRLPQSQVDQYKDSINEKFSDIDSNPIIYRLTVKTN